MKKICLAVILFLIIGDLQAQDKATSPSLSSKTTVIKQTKTTDEAKAQQQNTNEVSKPQDNPPLIPAASDSESTSKQLLQCNAIFDARKGELSEKIRQLDEKTQSIQALQNATQNLLDQREAKIKEREKALSLKLKEIEDKEVKLKVTSEEKESTIKALIAKNEDILKQIDGAKNNKLAQTYAKMKDSKAAPIIENLPDDEAASILFALSAQDMGKILSKMNPKKAAHLTEILKKGPPFENQKAKITQTNDNASKEVQNPTDSDKNSDVGQNSSI
ncbi:hypothetical protein BKH42_07955 [Helicobacter sp. 13S00482-2]|uniref:MotE family protein n=1 Tax=Helicobacter sp. 13S00482-2 TaxID=1476200 RepID=UPI000BA55717|nr:MotE family protein [Helicobacter sp. 13S00482-2]PAF53060.1 hypothetical protein BKH42_07955 [Helicobacter sp. 13S00482-2]